MSPTTFVVRVYYTVVVVTLITYIARRSVCNQSAIDIKVNFLLRQTLRVYREYRRAQFM